MENVPWKPASQAKPIFAVYERKSFAAPLLPAGLTWIDEVSGSAGGIIGEGYLQRSIIERLIK